MSDPVIPRPALIGAGALVLGSVVLAAIGARFGAHGTPDATPPIAARDLRFTDRADGSVVVSSAGDVVYVLAPGTNGFIRSTLRGLARARRGDGVGDAPPFRLTAWTDGRLTLDDRATGRRVDLEAFGRTNEAVLARLLTVKSPHT